MQVMVEVVMEAVVDEEVDKKVNEAMPEESKVAPCFNAFEAGDRPAA